jgi:hypothetical protein
MDLGSFKSLSFLLLLLLPAKLRVRTSQFSSLNLQPLPPPQQKPLQRTARTWAFYRAACTRKSLETHQRQLFSSHSVIPQVASELPALHKVKSNSCHPWKWYSGRSTALGIRIQELDPSSAFTSLCDLKWGLSPCWAFDGLWREHG